METVFKESEKVVLNELREKIAKVMGVTLQENYLTMRFNNKDGKLVAVTAEIVNIDDDSDDDDIECYSCSADWDIKHVPVDGAEHIKVPLCSDCRCPK